MYTKPFHENLRVYTPKCHQPARNKSLLKGYLTTMILYNNPLIEALFLGGGQVALGLTLDFHEP